MIQINDLNVRYKTDDGKDVHAVEDVDLELKPNETLGLVGESGCGKTTLAKSLIRLLARNGSITGGEILFDGNDLTEITNKEMRNDVRWSEISMIPQNAMNGFDPVHTIAQQIIQVVRKHEPEVSKANALERGKDLFEKVGLERDRIQDYPHQFSGGMAQRAMIAMALVLNPSIIIADEPTTALDVVIQNQILQLINELQERIEGSMILITHDMSVVSEVCDKTAVMYGGRIVEYGDTSEIISNPSHPYTVGLRNAFPDISKESQELVSIGGAPPDLIDPDVGCRFADRCPFAQNQCLEQTPELVQTDNESGGQRTVRCLRSDEADSLRDQGNKAQTWKENKPGTQNIDGGVDQ